jgi:hypothetical protein
MSQVGRSTALFDEGIDRQGIKAVLRFYQSGGLTGTSSAADLKSAFSRAPGVPLESAKADWLTLIRTGTSTSRGGKLAAGGATACDDSLMPCC